MSKTALLIISNNFIKLTLLNYLKCFSLVHFISPKVKLSHLRERKTCKQSQEKWHSLQEQGVE